ncbi:hypothetical protein [Candidatus Vidania fulgoroideorum]
MNIFRRYIAGIMIKKKYIKIFKNFKSCKNFKIKFLNNEIYITNNNINHKLLLNKKEILEIFNLKNNYNIILKKFFILRNIIKIEIFLTKKNFLKNF